MNPPTPINSKKPRKRTPKFYDNHRPQRIVIPNIKHTDHKYPVMAIVVDSREHMDKLSKAMNDESFFGEPEFY